MKSDFLENLVNEKNTNNSNDGIKNVSAINFSEIIEYVKGNISDKDFKNLCSDISTGKVSVGMDANAVNVLLANKNNSKVKELLETAKMPAIDIDVNSLAELSKEDFEDIRSMGVKVGKVYVNSGYDEAAANGYTPDIYEKIITNAEAMVKKTKNDYTKNNSGKNFDDLSDKDKFMAIYNKVISKAKYNMAAAEAKTGDIVYTSRNLQDFFIKNGSSVCAGIADSLVQLGKMCGLEIEYVQGGSQSKNMSKKEYHAWVRVKIDGKWYNADPTWDANHVNGEYGYCLKSDKDFDGHILDTEYNPSYRRNNQGRLIDRRQGGSRTYESAYDSYDSASLAEKYYTDDMGNRLLGYEELTDEQAEYLRSNHIPNAPSSSGLIAGHSFFTVFLNFLIKLTSFPAKVVNNVKKRLGSSRVNVSELSASRVKQELEKENEKEQAFEDIKVSQNKAESYLNMEQHSQKAKENKEEKEI